MKAIVFHRDRLVKIRYDNDSELNGIIKALSTVPTLDVDKRGYKG